MRYPNYPREVDPAERQRQRQQISLSIRLQGTNQKPQPPRDVRAIASARAVLVLWALPNPFGDIAGWRIYKDTEANLYREISDRGTRQCSVECSAGTTINVFVSSVNALGSPDGESQKVQVQAAATAEGGAPLVASTPPDVAATSGADTTSSIGRVGGGRREGLS